MRVRNIHLISKIAGWVVILICVIVLLGWQFNIDSFKRVISGFPVMTPLTAYILLSFALPLTITWSKSIKYSTPIMILVQTLASLGFIISIWTIIQYAFNLPQNVELIFYKNQVLSYGGLYPGRPSPHTAITGVLMYTSLVLSFSEHRNYNRLSAIIASVAAIIPWLALFGYASTTTPFFATQSDYRTGISILTSISYLMLVLGIMARNPNHGLLHIWFSSNSAGRLVRTLIPAIIIAQIALGWAVLYQEQTGLFSRDDSHGIVLGVTNIVYIIIMLWASTLLYKREQLKEKANQQQKSMIAQLKRSEERFRSLTKYAPYGIIIVDQKGKIQFANQQMEQMFGYSEKEMMHNYIEFLIPDKYSGTHIQHRNEYVKKPTTRQMGSNNADLMAKRKDGSEFFVDVALSVINTEIEGERFTLAIIRDITEKKQTELERKKYTTELEQKNKELEQFAYITSHDLQEPLRSMSGFISLLEQEYSDQLDEQANTYINFISSSSTRLSTLIHDLLCYTRIGSKKDKTKIDCNEIVTEVLKDLTHSIKETNATIEVSKLPIITAISTDIRLLFQNLISNALKYTKEGTPPIIKINCTTREKDWLFSIKDNGIGIDDKYKEKIFVIFQRLHLQSEYKGTGIGLSQCKKIVELHEGIIYTESEIGKGTTFFFTIPNNL